MLDVEGTQYDALIKDVAYTLLQEESMRLISRHW